MRRVVPFLPSGFGQFILIIQRLFPYVSRSAFTSASSSRTLLLYPLLLYLLRKVCQMADFFDMLKRNTYLNR